MNIQVRTTANRRTGEIHQTVELPGVQTSHPAARFDMVFAEMPPLDRVIQDALTSVMRTKERQTRDALIALGWSPPKETV